MADKNLIEQFADGLKAVVQANGPYYHNNGVYDLGDPALPPRMALAFLRGQVRALAKAVETQAKGTE